MCSKYKQTLFKGSCEVSDVQIGFFVKEGERTGFIVS